MDGWTLKQELQNRGMNLEQAARACGMDYATMGTLIAGGKTLPRLALKVAKGLHLTQQQAKTLGQPLDRKVWTKPNNGLPRPNPIDISPTWYERIKLDGSVGGTFQDRPVWLDIESIARYLWEMNRDVTAFVSEKGCTEQYINSIITDAVRAAAIEKVEKKWDVPPEIAETRHSLQGAVIKVRWSLDEELIAKTLHEKRLSRGDVVEMYKKRFNITGNNAADYIRRILRNGDKGGITLQAANRVCEVLGLDPHRDIEMRFVVQTTKREEKRKRAKKADAPGGGRTKQPV